MEERLCRGRDPDSEARGRLLTAATDLFARKGYAATAVREIVAAAGVTPPVLYYYFGNKEGLFLELMQAAWDQFDKAVEVSLGEPAGAKEKILGLAERILRLFREQIGVARIVYTVYYGPPQGAPHFDFDSYHTRFREAVLRLVKEGIERGELRPGSAEDMMWAVIGAINIAMEIELCHPGLSLGSEGLVRVIQTIFRGIQAADAGQEESS